MKTLGQIWRIFEQRFQLLHIPQFSYSRIQVNTPCFPSPTHSLLNRVSTSAGWNDIMNDIVYTKEPCGPEFCKTQTETYSYYKEVLGVERPEVYNRTVFPGGIV